MKPYFDIDEKLCEYTLYGDIDGIEQCIRLGANTNYISDEGSPIYICLYHHKDRLDIIELLLLNNAHVCNYSIELSLDNTIDEVIAMILPYVDSINTEIIDKYFDYILYLVQNGYWHNSFYNNKILANLKDDVIGNIISLFDTMDII